MSYELTGTAEGIVNGRRQTMPIDIRRLTQTGMYAVRWQKPAQGTWMLVITANRMGHMPRLRWYQSIHAAESRR
jgi:hypothetical protein